MVSCLLSWVGKGKSSEQNGDEQLVDGMVQFRADADKLPVLGPPTAVLIDGIEPQSRVGVVHGCVTLGSAALPMLVIIACLGPDGITGPTAENLFPFAIRTLGKVGADRKSVV